MRYAVHDGPGIRTTVFFKGCPLSCKWCHNPEGISPDPQQVYNAGKCIQCGHCASLCPTGARETIGYEITVPELMKEINKDILFYEQSGGGVTFSGGEPLQQGEFLLRALAQCREDCINAAVDSSGFGDTAILTEAAAYAKYILYDIKFFDAAKHMQYCGASNEIILSNLEKLASVKTKLLIRIPVIPTINGDLPEMQKIFDFIKNITTIEMVHLLPYHNIHTEKYRKIGMDYGLSGISADESANMKEIFNIFSAQFRTRIGG